MEYLYAQNGRQNNVEEEYEKTAEEVPDKDDEDEGFQVS